MNYLFLNIIFRIDKQLDPTFHKLMKIMKEQRLKSKEKKNGELETIKKQVRIELGKVVVLRAVDFTHISSR